MSWMSRVLRPICAGLGVVALLSGCGGGKDASSSGAPSEAPVEVSGSDPPPAASGDTSAELPLRRLSYAQYVSTLEDLTRKFLATDGTAVAGTVEATVRASGLQMDVPKAVDGQIHGGFWRTDQVVSQTFVDGTYAAAQALSDALTTTPARRSQLMGPCATDSTSANDAACLDAFVRRFGRSAWRRPLSDAEVTAYRALAGDTPVGAVAVSNVIAGLLTAPQFLYVIESGQPQATSVARVPLTAHELAARLSYHFWGTLPDDALAALADSGELLRPEVYAAQVTRLAAGQRADVSVREFFAQWFRLDELPELDSRVGDPVFNAFAMGFVPNANSRENANNEVSDMVSYVYRRQGSLRNVLTDRHAFARTADIAALYGMPMWDGVSEPPQFTDAQRAGLLTRIAFVASGSANTRPIMKGLRVRSALLCQKMPPAPPEAMNTSVQLAPDLTTREVIERLTQAPGTSCAGCHTNLLNPLGFVTENFDALGRSRSAQRLFDSAGNLVGQRPVNTQATLAGVGASGPSSMAGAVDATTRIAESGEFERCFANQYFSFTFGRAAASSDAPVLTELQSLAQSGRPLTEVMARIALRPEFMSRDFR